MVYREAKIADIRQIQFVRNVVKENRLSDPSLVSDKDCEEYMTIRGKAWVCEIHNSIVGFAYVDMQENNIWALFVKPEFENKGIGRILHDTMLNWYFVQTDVAVWLSTAPHSRAEGFYRKAGWKETGLYGKGEIKFEMTFSEWKKNKKPS